MSILQGENSKNKQTNKNLKPKKLIDSNCNGAKGETHRQSSQCLEMVLCSFPELKSLLFFEDLREVGYIVRDLQAIGGSSETDLGHTSVVRDTLNSSPLNTQGTAGPV